MLLQRFWLQIASTVQDDSGSILDILASFCTEEGTGDTSSIFLAANGHDKVKIFSEGFFLTLLWKSRHFHGYLHHCLWRWNCKRVESANLSWIIVGLCSQVEICLGAGLKHVRLDYFCFCPVWHVFIDAATIHCNIITGCNCDQVDKSWGIL